MKAKKDIDKLQADIQAARAFGERESREAPEGGTCNFDTPVVTLPRLSAEEQTDLGVYSMRYGIYKGMYAVRFRSAGQGNKDTVGAEAVARALKDRGYEAAVHYAID